jgi:molecular chaperone IbpA
MISILLQLGGLIMNSIDFTPLYRSSIGFDRLASLLDNALTTDNVSAGYPPYNIEVVDDNRYAISLALAGFEESDLDIKVEKNVLTVRGEKADSGERRYLHQGIANRSFERKFNLADYVEVTDAKLKNGLLTISLVKEIPEAMKPRSIAINQASNGVLEHHKEGSSESKSKVA